MREYLNKSVSTQYPDKSHNYIGYVMLDQFESREKYIKNCIAKNIVQVVLKSGGITDVFILQHLWNDIVFPETIETTGSQLFISWADGVLVAQGILPKADDLENKNENEFSFFRKYQNNYIEISGNAKSGNLHLTVDGGESAGEIIINVANSKKNSKLKIITKGSVQLDTTGKTDLYVEDGISIRNKQESFYEIFNDFIKDLNNTIVQTSQGPARMSPTTKQAFEKIKTRFNKIFNKDGVK